LTGLPAPQTRQAGLPAGAVIYVAAVSVDNLGLTSVLSNEITFTNGGPPSPPVNLTIRKPQ
jgi:hypothetical protein